MKYSLTTLGICFLIVLPISASQPGQPLDCSDWTIIQPGITCGEADFPPVCPGNAICSKTGTPPMDNAQHLFGIRKVNIGMCAAFGSFFERMDVYYVDLYSGNETIVATLADRCNLTTVDSEDWDPEGIYFDSLNGKLVFFLRMKCRTGVGGVCYPDEKHIVSFSGFAPLLEIVQSYDPNIASLEFAVPALPEGLPFANHFDSYWGTVDSLPDFTQSHPMSCSYPASAPVIGDFLTVADTSPTPPLGHANYIVVAVTHGTDRRYGRQLTGSTMTGRNPALLPVCE